MFDGRIEEEEEEEEEEDAWFAACMYVYEGWVIDNSGHNGGRVVRTYLESMVNYPCLIWDD